MKQNQKELIKKTMKKVALGGATIIGKELLAISSEIILSKVSFNILTWQGKPGYKEVLHWLYTNFDSIKDKFTLTTVNKRPRYLSVGIYSLKYKGCILIVRSKYRYKDSIVSIGSKKPIYTMSTDNILELNISIIGKNCNDIGEEINTYEIPDTSDSISISIYNAESKSLSITNSISVKNIDDIYIDNIDTIIKKLNSFKSNKKYYNDKKLVYKYAMMLYGDPGTGKTTLAKAIAKYLNYNIIYVTPKDITKDFISLMNNRDNTMILIEEIDKYVDDHGEIMNLGDLMNMTDGVLTPNNVFIVATTNFIEKIPEALIRNSRFDDVIEIKPINNKDVAENMCRYYDADINILNELEFPINQSKLQSKILERMN